MSVSLPVIAARGSHREIGRQIGEAAREQIRRSVAYFETNIEWLAGTDFAAAERRALALLPHAEHDLPQYVEELTGMAEAAGVPFAGLLVLNCGEEILCAEQPVVDGTGGGTGGADIAAPVAPRRPTDHCTCLAIATPGQTIVGHNEDWVEDDIENMIVLDITVPDGTRVLALTGAAYLPMCGFNSHGIAFYGNTVYANDELPGVPNIFKHRWLLEARTREEADARARMRGRARGSNHLNARAGGEIWDIEVSAESDTVLGPETAAWRSGETATWLVHTNHYTAAEMREVERSDSTGSRQRLARGRELVAAGLAAGDDPLALVTRALDDHANAPYSICAHPIPDDAEHGPTTGSVIIELEERRLHVCAGRPCENPRRVISLD